MKAKDIVNLFWAVYHKLSEQGKCDATDSVEFRRVFMEWYDQLPTAMAEFITKRANAVPKINLGERLNPEKAIHQVIDRHVERFVDETKQCTSRVSLLTFLLWSERLQTNQRGETNELDG